jgi:hypothetical protein
MFIMEIFDCLLAFHGDIKESIYDLVAMPKIHQERRQLTQIYLEQLQFNLV